MIDLVVQVGCGSLEPAWLQAAGEPRVKCRGSNALGIVTFRLTLPFSFPFLYSRLAKGKVGGKIAMPFPDFQGLIFQASGFKVEGC